MIVEHIAT